MKGQLWAGLVRTAVPLIVGWLLAFPVVAQLGISEAEAERGVTLVLAFAYWLLGRVFEVFVKPRLGGVLGKVSPFLVRTAPVYGTIVGAEDAGNGKLVVGVQTKKAA